MNTFTIITLLIAVYGAFLSTYSLIVSRKDKKAKLHIIIEMSNTSPIKQTKPPFFQIRILNVGLFDIRVSKAILIVKNSRDFIETESKHVDFPYDLERGKSFHLLMDMEDIAIKLNNMGFQKRVRVRGKVFDAIGNEYKSRSANFNVNKWFPGKLN